ncbi:hypothetical protein GF352_00760 [archaeon]|nr:hypothetical protein [archaeon]
MIKKKRQVLKTLLLKNEAGLRYKEYLVIADPHLGIEREYWAKGYEMPSQNKSILKRIKRIKKDSEKLIILGDLKHNIPNITIRERKEVPGFIEKLNKLFKEVIIIKGNHDGNLERLVNGVKKEHYVDDTAFIHGHTVSKKALKSKKIIAGHTHPVYAYKNHLGLKQSKKCFIITDKIIILPAFTELSAGSHELAKPLRKHITNEERILLDHTKVK